MITIHDGGETRGPYELAQIKSMWGQGLITAAAQYFHKGSGEWRPISELTSRAKAHDPSEGIELPRRSAPSVTRERAPVTVITTQLTSKKIKLATLIGSVIYFPAFFFGVINFVRPDSMKVPLFSSGLIWAGLVVGGVTLICAQAAKWWFHE